MLHCAHTFLLNFSQDNFVPQVPKTHEVIKSPKGCVSVDVILLGFFSGILIGAVQFVRRRMFLVKAIYDRTSVATCFKQKILSPLIPMSH